MLELPRLVIINLPSGSNSVVECDLAKVEVAGSNPVSRSRISAKAKAAPSYSFAKFTGWIFFIFWLRLCVRGAVPKW